MVELRSRTHLNSHLHYIRAIKDGSIKIVTNMDARGKSKLRFRQLVDVYSQENIRDDNSIPSVVRDLDNSSDMTQGSCLFGAEVNIKTDPEDFSMPLKKIWKQCKENKRKLRNRKDTETASNDRVKQEYLTQDEGCDIEEPLSSWNTKFSKRRKKNQERKAKRCSTSSPSVEKINSPVFFDGKPEAWDNSCSVSEAMDLIPTDHLRDCNKKLVLVEEIASSKDMRLVPYCSAEPHSPGMVADEELIATKPEEKAYEDASEEFNDARKGKCCLADNIDLDNKEIELKVPSHSEYGNFSCVKDLISFDFDTSPLCEEVKENEESNNSKPNLDMIITSMEIVKIEAPDILGTDYSSLPITDFGVEKNEIVWGIEHIAIDDLPEATDILQVTNNCNSLDTLQPVPDDSTILFEENQLPESLQQFSSSKHEDKAGNNKVSQLDNGPDEVKTAPETDSIQHQKLHHQPEKLLSGRKALSPTSQLKLRKAMELPDSPERRSKKSKGKLYFRSQNSRRIPKAQGLNNIDRKEIIPTSKQVIQKANKTRQTQYRRAKHKSSRRDKHAAKSQPFSTGCTSIQGCTQKAIAFSEGQMHDFVYVAAKLTKELKTMTQVSKRCLLDESNTSNMSECNLDEVKTLIRNAERTEKSSKKWLSSIERDCNRFCKLMGMVKEDSPATENIVQKEKKIKFADDAGGDLCHVKVFEIDLESES